MIAYGFILAMVWLTAEGIVQGETLDYFTEANECWEAVMWEYENEYHPAPMGFTCIPDVAETLEP